MAEPDLSVVIPNWNGKRFLAACLGSLRRQTYQRISVIIVDNASNDGSQAFIRDSYPEVRLIELSETKALPALATSASTPPRAK